MPRDSDALKIEKWAAGGDVADPEDRSIDRDVGWGTTYSTPGGALPAREVFNELHRELTALAVELNTHGLLEWDTAVAYDHPAVVMGSDNVIYISVQDSTGRNPTTDTSDTYWKRLEVRGWSPEFAIKPNLTRQILQLVDWHGGDGTKPTTYVNQYVGVNGFVTLPSEAVDIRGPRGQQGAQGPAGTNGTDGREVQLRVSGGNLQWRYAGSGSWTTLVAVAGVQGPAGTPGADGRELEIRINGNNLETRYEGETAWTSLGRVTGMQGPAGPAGATGPAGMDGAAGPAGAQGLQGAQGTQGRGFHPNVQYLFYYSHSETPPTGYELYARVTTEVSGGEVHIIYSLYSSGSWTQQTSGYIGSAPPDGLAETHLYYIHRHTVA